MEKFGKMRIDKNIEFDAPSEKLTPQKLEGRNLTKFRIKLLRQSRSNLTVNQNQIIKNIFVFNKIRIKIFYGIYI